MLCCLLLQSINKSYGRMGGWAEDEYQDEIKMNSCDEKVAYNSEYATTLKCYCIRNLFSSNLT